MRRSSEILVPLEMNPLESYLQLLCALTGVAGFFMAPAHPRFAALDWAWYTLLIFGGLGGLLSHLWQRDKLTALLVTRAAWIPAGFGAYVFAALTSMTGHPMTALLVFAFGAATHLRALQITRLLRPRR